MVAKRVLSSKSRRFAFALQLFASMGLTIGASSALAETSALSDETHRVVETAPLLPKIYTSLAPAPVRADHLDSSLLPAVSLSPAPDARGRLDPPTRNRYVFRKVVNYKRRLEVGDDEVIVRLVSPGKRKSLMSLEVKF